MSNRITYFVNTSCKLISSVQQCIRLNSLQQNEKHFCRHLSSYPDHFVIRTFSTFNYDRLRSRTISEDHSKTLELSRYGTNCYLRCNNFSTQIGPNRKNINNNNYKNLSLFQKFKFMWKNYWYVLVPVHVVTSIFWFGGFYYIASSGIDVINFMQTLGVPETVIETVKSSKAGNVAGNAVAAFALYKIATPARYFVTIGGTTLAINVLRKRGKIQPAGNKEQIKILYDKQKDALKNFQKTYQGKMQVTKDELLKTKDDLRKQIKEHREELEKSMVQSHRDVKTHMQWVTYGLKNEMTGLRGLFFRFTRSIQNLIKIKKDDK